VNGVDDLITELPLTWQHAASIACQIKSRLLIFAL